MHNMIDKGYQIATFWDIKIVQASNDFEKKNSGCEHRIRRSESIHLVTSKTKMGKGNRDSTHNAFKNLSEDGLRYFLSKNPSFKYRGLNTYFQTFNMLVSHRLSYTAFRAHTMQRPGRQAVRRQRNPHSNGQ